MLIPSSDRIILGDLARELAEIAALPVQAEKKQLWYEHNALRPTRPLIFCSPENSWNEILPPSTLACESSLGRAWEWDLRMLVFWGNEMGDDQVIEPCFTVPLVYTDNGWGVRETLHRTEPLGSYRWDPPLKDLADLSLLRFPEITIDWQASDDHLAEAQAIFGEHLQVSRKTFWWWTLGLTQPLAFLHGLEQILWDMVDHPTALHQVMAFLRDGTLAKLNALEAQGLLCLNNGGEYVGSGGFGWTDELPQKDYTGQVRTKDMWGFCESQETNTISPAMFEEFVFQYQLPILERFGLNCYGCCEPLDTRWKVVKQTPRLRRVSISPWSNLEKMAEHLEDRYIFSMKPNPAELAAPVFDEDQIRSGLRHALEVTRGCRVEIIMKDNHTICNDPRRVLKWVKIAKEEAERIWI
jgi:hypothetical protein